MFGSLLSNKKANETYVKNGHDMTKLLTRNGRCGYEHALCVCEGDRQ